MLKQNTLITLCVIVASSICTPLTLAGEGFVDDGGLKTPIQRQSDYYLRNNTANTTDEQIDNASGGDPDLGNQMRRERDNARGEIIRDHFRGIEYGDGSEYNNNHEQN